MWTRREHNVNRGAAGSRRLAKLEQTMAAKDQAPKLAAAFVIGTRRIANESR